MKNSCKGRIAVVGMGPGMESMMTMQALKALDAADVIVGYTVYLDLLGDRFKDKELLSTLGKLPSSLEEAKVSASSDAFIKKHIPPEILGIYCR